MKILLIRFSSLGDVVLAAAAVEGLREALPGAEVHVLTKPQFRDAFRNHPGVAGLVPWEPGDPLGSLTRELRSRSYDWVIDLHRNLRTTLLRLAVRGPRWSVYRKGVWRRRLAVWLRSPKLLDASHVVDRYGAALEPLGVTPRRRLPRVYPGERDREEVGRLLRKAGWNGQEPLIGLAPGARWATKAWPPDRWADLLRVMALEGLGFPVFLGGPEEADLCGSILDSSGSGGANLAGRTSILETAALLATCSVLVSNDSAPLHLATAVGTPIVALFGPTVRGFGFYPIGPHDAVVEAHLDCRPCSLHGDDACPQGHHRCLRELEAPEVAKAVRDGVSQARAS